MSLRFIQSLLFAFILLSSCSNNKSNPSAENSNQEMDTRNLDSFIIDKAESIIYWIGSSPGGEHNGSLKFLDGKLYSQNKVLKSGQASMDMKSIAALDIQDPSDKSDLEHHLKDIDFFSVDSFPLSQFKMTSITMIQNDVFNAIIHGLLTIKNVTRPLQVKAKVDITENMIMISVPEFTIDRTDYNIMYQSKKLLNVIKDEFIHDEVTLSIKLNAKKEQS